jgi:hypothetical protein
MKSHLVVQFTAAAVAIQKIPQCPQKFFDPSHVPSLSEKR